MSSKPGMNNAVATHTCIHTARNGFHFGQFRHFPIVGDDSGLSPVHRMASWKTIAAMFGKYLASVFETMEGKMSGICSLVLTIAATYSTFFTGVVGMERARVYLWVAAALTFLYANYAAWKREHEKVVSANPDIKMSLEQVNWELGEGNNNTVLIFAVYLLNIGAPSITRGWHGSIKFGHGGDERLFPIHISGPWILARDNQSVIINPEDSIVAKTIEKRLETGEGKAGRAFFTIPGDRTDQLKAANFRATIGCLDFRGNLIKTEFVPQGPLLSGVQIYPGEKGSILPKLPESDSHNPPSPPEGGR